MEYLTSGIVLFLIFSAVVLVHEAGHFFAAKLGKIKTEEFGFGLPPRLWGVRWKKNGTLFSINGIPFGGFVKLLGEDGTSKKKNAFGNRPMIARITTVCAGVAMNFLFGWLLLAIGFAIGMKPIILNRADFDTAVQNGTIVLDNTKGVFVSGVDPESPAEKAGIQSGDYIVAIDTTRVETSTQFIQRQQLGLRGREFHISILRKKEIPGNVSRSFVALVRPNAEGKLGLFLTDDKPIIEEKKVQYSLPVAAGVAVYETGRLVVATINALGDAVVSFTRHLTVPDSVGGPVAIAQITHQYVIAGIFSEILKLAALISISVATVNIMPFPALDGGRLVLLIGEIILRRKPNATFERWLNAVGFAFLLLLIGLVTKNDLIRVFG